MSFSSTSLHIFNTEFRAGRASGELMRSSPAIVQNDVPEPEHPPSPDYVPGPEHPPSPVEPSPTALSPRLCWQTLTRETQRRIMPYYPAGWRDGANAPYLCTLHQTPQTKVPFAQTRLHRARKTVRLEPPMSPSMEARIARYAAAPTPPSLPSSPLSPWEDIPEAELPPRKRLCPTAPTSRYEVGESSTAAPRPTRGHRADYRFIGTMDAEIRRQRAEEVDYGIRDVWEQDTQDIYVVIEDTQDMQTQLFQRVDRLVEDRQFHYETTRLLDREALISREAWAYSVGLSSEVSSLQGQLSAALSGGQIMHFSARDRHGLIKCRQEEPLLQLARLLLLCKELLPHIHCIFKQLIEAKVSAALANHETLRNNTNGHGDESHNSDTGIKGTARTPRESTYKDFLNCKPLTFKGTEGVVVLSQWFEKMESVFHISNCAVENQNALKKMMTVKYCPKGEIKSRRIRALKPKSKKSSLLLKGKLSRRGSWSLMLETIRHQQQNKRQNTRRAYTAGPGEKREYTGSLPFCTKCNYHHKRSKSPGVISARRSVIWLVTVGVLVPMVIITIVETSGQLRMLSLAMSVEWFRGHFKKTAKKLKNGNRGNQRGNGNAPAKVYVVGNAGTNPDSNVVTGTFLLNDRYASILFDTGADRSFISTTFSSLIDITPTTLDHYYDVELADGKIIGINTIIRGCTLNFLDHPFNINLMPVELGSFDVIISMDWLSKYHALIDCAEKIVRIP
ncbi:putative reverse transcriptase domain-containing protein [Tanacetum coccineum]